MGLAYLYIEEFKNIYNQEFNFSSKYKFHYDKNSATLVFEENQDYLVNFFGQKIYNVNAVIGKNGTGKSALIEFILGNVSTGKKNKWREKFILLMEDNKTIWHHNELIISNEIEGWSKKTFPTENQNNGEEMPLNRNLFFYYSNIFDGVQKEFQFINSQNRNNTFIDLSTNNIIDFYQKSGNSTQNHEQISSYRNREIDRYLKFILGWRAEQERQRERGNNNVDQYNIPFRIPKYIRVKPSKYISLEFLINAKNNSGYIIDRAFVNEVKGIYDYLNSKKTFKHSLVLSILFGFFYQTPNMSVLQGGNYPKILELLQESDLTKPSELVELIVDFGSTNKQFLANLISDVLNIHSVYEESEELILELTSENEERINQILDFVNGIYLQLTIQVFLDCGFSESFIEDGLSTGEKAWLSLYSRFWLHKDNFNVHGRQSIIVLLDEPDIGFHPNWQRKLIQQIVYFITIMFGWINYSMDELNRKIHFIITSHSPFIVSDLPKQCVTFLSKDEDGFCQVSEGIKMQDTFASNIHTLLSDSFFMYEGLVGEFAKNKINKVFDDLYAHKEDENFTIEPERIKEIKKIISLIGEPLIAKKLAYLFDETFQSDLQGEYIQKQINYWQNLKNNRNSNDSN